MKKRYKHGARGVIGTGLVAALFAIGFTALPASGQDRRDYPPPSSIPSMPIAVPVTATTPRPAVNPAVNLDTLRLSECMLALKKEAWISGNTQGVIRSLATCQRDAAGNIIRGTDGNSISVEVTAGMPVWEGQVLGSQDDRLARADLKIAETEYAVAIAEAAKQIEVEHARTAWMVEDAKVQMLEATNAQVSGAVMQSEILEAKMKRKQAEAQFELCQYTLGVREKEALVKQSRLEAAAVQVELRQFVAPWNGEVADVKAAEGEWLREGDDVLRLIQMERLRVLGKVDSRQYAPEMLRGRPVTVAATMIDGRIETFPASVVFTDYQVRAGETFVIHIEVDNRRHNGVWMLQPGKMVDVTINLKP